MNFYSFIEGLCGYFLRFRRIVHDQPVTASLDRRPDAFFAVPKVA
jgi:hypothetical protein